MYIHTHRNLREARRAHDARPQARKTAVIIMMIVIIMAVVITINNKVVLLMIAMTTHLFRKENRPFETNLYL